MNQYPLIAICLGAVLCCCEPNKRQNEQNDWPPVPPEPRQVEVQIPPQVRVNTSGISYSRLAQAGYDPIVAAKRYVIPVVRILEEDFARKDFHRFLALVGHGGYEPGLMQDLVGGIQTVETYYANKRGLRFISPADLREQWNADIISGNDARLPVANIMKCLGAAETNYYYIEPDYIGHLVFDIKVSNSAAEGYFAHFLILVEIPGDEQVEVYFMMEDYAELKPTKSCILQR